MVIETDYLIVGAGAVGLAVADVLLAETDATLMLVDRDAEPGGHWNRAYPFVRLHQPGVHYGVMSRALESDVDLAGDKMAALTDLPRIRAYFRSVLEDVLLASGRVRYLPMSEVTADGTVRALLTGATQDVRVRRKVIEAYHGGGTIPATHVPGFAVDPGARLIPVGGLADLREPAACYVILGSGKTAIDACLWLMQQGVSPESITWVMPRDSWFLDRRGAQPGAGYHDLKLTMAVAENRALLASTSVRDLFARLESAGNLLRLDPDVEPESYKCATVTQDELARLRQIGDVVRKGHITRLGATSIDLTRGELALPDGALCVDCTATAIPNPPPAPIFQPGRIVMNQVRTCQPCFSAALIGHLEATQPDDARKNELARIVPLPRDAEDWLRMNFVNRQNQFAWMQDPDLRAWLKTCRLDALTNAARPEAPSAETQALAAEFRETMFPATVRLKQFVDALPGR